MKKKTKIIIQFQNSKVFTLFTVSLSFAMQTTLARSGVRPASVQTSSSRTATATPRRVRSSRRSNMAARASLDNNIVVNVFESAVAIALPVAVSIVTAEKSDDEFIRTKSVEGLIPIGAAVAADAVAHSIPGEFELFF